jgi:hypothetical protein
VLKKQCAKCGVGSCKSRFGIVVGSCEQGKEPEGSISGGVFIDCLNSYELLKCGYLSATLHIFLRPTAALLQGEGSCLYDNEHTEEVSRD